MSSNWAGYAVHRSGVSFRQVSASWREPAATCTRGQTSYSAFWVGLGGYRRSSHALEQIGTELDCKRSGTPVSGAWYELVPRPARLVGLRVRAGDLIQASVTVAGHLVTLKLFDSTSGHGFQRTVRAARVDVSSAEWIVEAPSKCISLNICATLPLTNFGSATFGSAQAQSTGGHSGPISDRAWSTTVVSLAPGGHRYVEYQGSGPAFGAATPSALMLGGTSFAVHYSKVTVTKQYFSALAPLPRSAYLAHTRR